MSKQLKNSLLVSILLLLSLTAWPICSPVGSGVDTDYHLGVVSVLTGKVRVYVIQLT